MRARAEWYQISLILLGIVAVGMFAAFVYREVAPEYRIYQEDYIALEKFRSSYTHEPSPEFKPEVKQIVIERADKGPPIIDRCVSCHVALEIPYFSPTKIDFDINGQIRRDASGKPVQVPNEDYIWAKLDQRIADLTDATVIEHLRSTGDTASADQRLKEANQLEALKIAKVDHVYDVTKVLAMHPLIGKETRPFEFHSLQEYGCVSCHNGNGRGLTTERAHGPIFDGEYEIEYMGPKPEFLEKDSKNDPRFSKMFNEKPGAELLFQTTPIFIGALVESKCIQCHQLSSAALQGSLQTAGVVTEHHEHKVEAIKESYESERRALVSLIQIKKSVEKSGLQATLEELNKKSQDYALPSNDLQAAKEQTKFITQAAGKPPSLELLKTRLEKQMELVLGTPELVQKLEKAEESASGDAEIGKVLDDFINEHRNDSDATGSIFAKAAAWDLEQALMQHVKDTTISVQKAVNDQTFLNAIVTDTDELTSHFRRGEELYISQACYACHRIAGFARGGVGPELTREGKNAAPWFIKESLVWPQADLSTSTMPNYRMDHNEIEDLVTYLLAQTGESKAIGTAAYKIAIQEWEEGRKSPWEKPITPAQMHDLRYGMTVFATEGCAACHRMDGFESNVGFSIEKNKEKPPSYLDLLHEHNWFSQLIPETIAGSQIVEAVDKDSAEIDKRIVDGVRQNSILEEIESTYPGHIEALYSNFKFAARAKNDFYAKKIAAESDPAKIAQLTDELKQWKERIHRLSMMYIQEYGLGRMICPKPSWAGVYRTDEWLMEHFHNPSAHVPRSMMPAFPFDETKFYALTHMLDVLGRRNRDNVHAIWEHRGFNPEMAFLLHCAQCHGEMHVGNGPVSEWIYPVPKNLANADFLRNLTRENAIQSITHGVKGTPMPPWGEAPKNKPNADGIPILNPEQIKQLVDWLFSELPGGQVIKEPQDVPKWHYTPQDILQELKREGNTLEPPKKEKPLSALPQGTEYFASLDIPQGASTDESVTSIFDVTSPPIPGGIEKHGYYIKKQFYTPQNIEKGKQFFELNCAVCHGAEADGSGLRAEIMSDAKPRMLTNLDWINTRDDLRLLRSIKYGVSGTAMTPWGDFTSSLQRLQLVIFIRSLTEGRSEREELMGALYQSFDAAQIEIERARINAYADLEKIQKEYDAAKTRTISAYKEVEKGSKSTQEAIKPYEEELNLRKQLNARQAIDKLYVDLKAEVKKEETVYHEIGLDLLSAKPSQIESFKMLLKIIKLNEGRYSIKDGKLDLTWAPEREKQIVALGSKMIKELDEKIENLEEQAVLAESEQPEEGDQKELNAQLTMLTKVRNKAVENLAAAARSRKKQADLFEEFRRN